MRKIESIKDLIEESRETSKPVSEVVIDYETRLFNKTRGVLVRDMKELIEVMEESIKKGRKREGKTHGRLFENETKLLLKSLESGNTLSGKLIANVMVDAMAIASYNASMGRIVAAPTAGACGILPAALFNVRDELKLGMAETVNAMFVADGIGHIIKKGATVSGAEGGCQAECGTAAAMAAGAIVALRGADAEVIFDAAALALKNSLGLTCDPVAGLVEVPCIKRNAFFAVHAILAADLAVCGIKSVIPFDEVIEAMKYTGDRMPKELKETSEGGLAITDTAKSIEEKISED